MIILDYGLFSSGTFFFHSIICLSSSVFLKKTGAGWGGGWVLNHKTEEWFRIVSGVLMKMFIELRHLILRHMLGVYAGKIVLNLIELRHYFSRRFQVLRVAKNPLKLSKSAKSVSANAENCVIQYDVFHQILTNQTL